MSSSDPFSASENPNAPCFGGVHHHSHLRPSSSDAPLYVLLHPDPDTNMTEELEVLRNALIDARALIGA